MNAQFDASREGQLDEKSLKWGYWWITHKIQLRRWLYVAVGLFGVITLGYGLFGLADYYFGSGVAESRVIGQITRQLSPYVSYNQAHAPQDLEQEEAFALPSGTDRYDLVARVTNPNDRWIALFDYSFQSGSTKTTPVAGYVLPGSSSWLSQVGYKADGSLAGAALQIENFRWQRINNHKTLPDYATWAASRLNVKVSDQAFVRPATGDSLGTSRATFKLTNDTAFSYYKVPLVVLLWGDGGALVGVNRIIVSDLRAGTSRTVEAVWFGDVSGAKTVEVQPIIDIFNDANYIPVGK